MTNKIQLVYTLHTLPPLHSTPLHSTPLHSTPLHSTPLHSTPLHSLHSTPSTPLHSTPSTPSTPQPLHSLHSTPSAPLPPLHSTPLHSTPLPEIHSTPSTRTPLPEIHSPPLPEIHTLHSTPSTPRPAPLHSTPSTHSLYTLPLHTPSTHSLYTLPPHMLDGNAGCRGQTYTTNIQRHSNVRMLDDPVQNLHPTFFLFQHRPTSSNMVGKRIQHVGIQQCWMLHPTLLDTFAPCLININLATTLCVSTNGILVPSSHRIAVSE